MPRVFLIGLILIANLLQGQNLVPNGDFENYLDCPDGLRQIDKVVDWFSASSGTPEYFNTCGFSAEIEPHSEKAMLGIIAYAAYDSDLEYVSVKLLSPLIRNQTYCLSYYIQADESNPVFNSNIEAFLSPEKFKMAYWKLGTVQPQVIVKTLPNAKSWTQVQSTFKAKGGESYLCIGNFRAKEKVQVHWNRKPESQAWYSYYYLDDVRLVAIENGCDEDLTNSHRKLQLDFKKKITLYFDSDEFALSLEEQKRLIFYLNQLPNKDFIQLSLSGHTDTDASEAYNLNLSLQRVEEVGRFIEKQKSLTLIKQWEGEQNLVNSSYTEEEKALNRRVEVNYIP